MDETSPPPCDFPAAHSMDTEWFAVDEAGRVVRFYTWENGALPDNAAFGFGPMDPNFDEKLLEAFLVGRLLARGLGPELETSLTLPSPERVVVVAERLEAYADLVDAGELEIAREREPAVLLTRGHPDEQRLRELAGRAGFRGFVRGSELRDALSSDNPEDGLLRFHHNDGDDPDYYVRESLPSEPLRPEDLPASIRDAVGRVKIPVDLVAVESLHLGEHLGSEPITTWNNSPMRIEPLEQMENWTPLQGSPAAVSPRVPPKVWIPAVLLLAALAAWLLLR
jgi:hypothetical protein